MPAAITARLIDLRLLTRTSDRGLRPAPDYQARIDSWLRPYRAITTHSRVGRRQNVVV